MNTLDNIYKTYSLYTIISAVVILSYLPTFTGGFILDDNDLIKNNELFVCQRGNVTETVWPTFLCHVLKYYL